MSYIDAYWDRNEDKVFVVERDPKKGRIVVEYPAKYQFYSPDVKGKYTSIFGDRLAKITSKSWKEHKKEERINSNGKMFEQDINPIFRCLEENYLGKDAPKLNVAFWDIEVDMQAFAVSSQQMVRVRKKQ